MYDLRPDGSGDIHASTSSVDWAIEQHGKNIPDETSRVLMPP